MMSATRSIKYRNSPCKSKPKGWACKGALILGALWGLGCERPVDTYPLEMARTSGSRALHWRNDVIELSPVSLGDAQATEVLIRSLTVAAEHWNVALRGCRAPKLRVGRLNRHPTVTRNNVNQVTLRTNHWCPDGSEDVLHCYDKQKTALTNSYLALDGSEHVVEADVELNGVGYGWTTGDEEGKFNLERILTHELGHVLGLGEVCRSPQEATARPLPGCDALEVQRSVMFPGMFRTGTLQPLPVALPGRVERQLLCEEYSRR